MAFAKRSISPPSARSASTWKQASSCGATTRWRTRRRTSRRRSCAGTHVFLSSAYGTGAALLELTPASSKITARQVYFTRDMRNHHATSVLVGDYLYGFSDAILDGDEVRFGTGGLARSQRGQRLGGVRRRPPVSLQRTGCRRARRGDTRRAIESTAVFRSTPGARRRGATRSCRTGRCSFAIRTISTRFDVRQK